MKKLIVIVTIITFSFGLGVHYGFTQGMGASFTREMMWSGFQAAHYYKKFNLEPNDYRIVLDGRVSLGIDGYIDYQESINTFLAEWYLQPLSGSIQEDNEKFISYLLAFREGHPSVDIEKHLQNESLLNYQQRKEKIERIMEAPLERSTP